MPFSSSKITRSALTLALIGALLAATGCSTISKTVDKVWPWGQEDDLAGIDEAPTPAAPEEEASALLEQMPELAPETTLGAPTDVLTYWETIDGGLLADPTGMVTRTLGYLAGGTMIHFVRPTAIAARDDYLYVVDMGLNQVLRYQRSTGHVESLLELGSVSVGDVEDIYVTRDLGFLLADSDGARVLQYDGTGRLVQRYENRLNLSRPVAVVEDEPTGDILVADGVFDHIAVFKPDGELVAALGGRGIEPGRFLNITTMTIGPDGFYVGARVGQPIQVLDRNGDYLYSIDRTGVRFPLAIAVAPDFHVFVGDYLDNSIKVYQRGRFLTSIGGTGVGPGKFKRITDMWLDSGFLYVVDSLNGRIQVMRVTTEPGAPASPAPLESTGG